LCSAFGAAISKLRIERVQTIAALEADVDDGRLRERFDSMLQKSRSEIAREGGVGESQESLVISMRYGQQNYEQDIAYDPSKGLACAVERFHQRHHEFYGYHFEDEPIELVHLKISLSEASRPPKIHLKSSRGKEENKGTRNVVESGGHQVPTVIYDRDQLKPGDRFTGPSIVEEIDSTTYVPGEVEVQVDHSQNLLLTLDPKTS
jgi:N-methylhydantoinase A